MVRHMNGTTYGSSSRSSPARLAERAHIRPSAQFTWADPHHAGLSTADRCMYSIALIGELHRSRAPVMPLAVLRGCRGWHTSITCLVSCGALWQRGQEGSVRCCLLLSILLLYAFKAGWCPHAVLTGELGHFCSDSSQICPLRADESPARCSGLGCG